MKKDIVLIGYQGVNLPCLPQRRNAKKEGSGQENYPFEWVIGVFSSLNRIGFANPVLWVKWIVSHRHLYIALFTSLGFFSACTETENLPEKIYFQRRTAQETGLDFINQLDQDEDLNIFNYMYFFNGSGVGVGDFNQDGLPDIYLGANLSVDALFLNEGNLKFKKVTAEAGLSNTTDWTTGVSVVDINNDGLLDIYLSQVGGFRELTGSNKLFVCQKIENGIPVFEEQTAQYGLEFQGFGTHAAFFDYDLDGDLDLFQMNHSVHENGTFGQRASFVGKVHPASGDRLLRNDGGKFVDVSQQAGINQSEIGYGLGLSVGDLNNDGWPDIYIGNDFHENDYLYLNQQNGTFKEVAREQINHSSRFSMGTEIGDINNDGWNDIFSLDMAPYDPFIKHSSLGEDDFNIYDFKLKYGYSYQYARNNLQLNNGDNSFSEIGYFADVYATDWSWAALFLDLDFDGKNDLFVSNGIPRRMNDMDYANYRASDEDHRWKSNANMVDTSDLQIVDRIPQIKIPNQFFLNKGSLQFENISGQVSGNQETYSNGAAYADLDGDGDLDLVVNNINDRPFIYENLLEKDTTHSVDFLQLKLRGPAQNRFAIGATVLAYKGEQILSNAFFPARSYQSSMHTDLVLGVGDKASIDSVLLIWPDQTFSKLESPVFNQPYEVAWQQGLPKYSFIEKRTPKVPEFTDVTDSLGLNLSHKENDFVEFLREKLIPFMVSAEGPAVAIADVNGDGLEDVFLGSAKRETSQLLFQTPDGKLEDKAPALFQEDKMFEDVDAEWVDIDKDGDLDLVIASGGNEFWGESENLLQRIYLNDGKGNLIQKLLLEGSYTTASRVEVADLNQDGYPDLFFAGRAKPKNYGLSAQSFLFLNNQDGTFTEVTAKYLPSRTLGLITDAKWTDIDNDGDEDLVVTEEWGKVSAWMNEGNVLIKKEISQQTGWWRFVLPQDFDQDGDIDLLVGNAGLNHRLKPTKSQPVEMYIADFDQNNQVEQIVTFYLQGRRTTLANHRELTSQLPFLKKKFLYAKDFAAASIEEIFGEENLKKAAYRKAETFEHTYFENLGNGTFAEVALPLELQLSTLNVAQTYSIDQNQTKLLVGGNFFHSSIEIGRLDASYGHLLSIGRQGDFRVESLSPVKLNGQIAAIEPFQLGGKPYLLVIKNDGKAQLLNPKDSEYLTKIHIQLQ